MTVTETPTRKILHSRVTPVKCVVVHSSGNENLAECLRYYTSGDKDACQPHYFLETGGRIHRIAPEDKVASHCAIFPEEVSVYARGYSTWSRYIWDADKGRPVDAGSERTNYVAWRDVWRAQGIQSPLELVSGRRPNVASIGIELQPPEHYEVDKYTDAQYESLTDLLADIWRRQKVPMDRAHVLGHYDCSPLRRSNAQGSTDPGRTFNYLRIWDMLRIHRPIV